ncbi:hypothetical protein DM44_6489 [Burkholderia cepacia]|jgi:hypothetical protein|nr:hypothetical protein DM42_6966 [Burkholderia cepacia]KGC05067.1 hypothetical protein DM44_6489 [Burkholderia cepacia]
MNGRWVRKMDIPRDILKGAAERFIEEQRTELRKVCTRARAVAICSTDYCVGFIVNLPFLLGKLPPKH